MERGLNMVLHAAIITAIAYVLMVNFLNQQPHMAENRSILLGAIVLVYMLMFGHEKPSLANLNKMLM